MVVFVSDVACGSNRSDTKPAYRKRTGNITRKICWSSFLDISTFIGILVDAIIVICSIFIGAPHAWFIKYPAMMAVIGISVGATVEMDNQMLFSAGKTELNPHGLSLLMICRKRSKGFLRQYPLNSLHLNHTPN